MPARLDLRKDWVDLREVDVLGVGAADDTKTKATASSLENTTCRRSYVMVRAEAILVEQGASQQCGEQCQSCIYAEGNAAS
jgi:hypothetical protein